MLCVGTCNALRRQMQSFALAHAKLCVSGCKALRWHMQSFALAHAKLCVGRCNALRLRWAELPHKNGDTFVIQRRYPRKKNIIISLVAGGVKLPKACVFVT